ncbi:hypothetical protein ACEUZ9_004671 [Paracoccus litorisediminis]|uniref:hypothetical protein n=1 Tax=Paracoccus litorisediminis TaxID=2006130 RepID=UPI00372D90A1
MERMQSRIRIVVDIFERRYPSEFTPLPDIPDGLLHWYRTAFSAINVDALPPATWHDCEPDMDREIELLLCSRQAMNDVLESDALGLCILTTPDTDPFGEGTEHVGKLRCAVVIDQAEVEARLLEEMRKDGENWPTFLWKYEEAEAITAFHELAHSVLFASNSLWVSPQAAANLHESGSFNYDLFDIKTGYGIRALPDEGGVLRDAEDADAAYDLMEEWCELQGRLWYCEAMAGQTLGFYDALGLDPDAIWQRGVAVDDPSNCQI